MATSTAPALIDARAVAELLNCSARHVQNLDAAGRIPRSTKLGVLRRWNAAEVEAWLNEGCPDRAEWEALKAQQNGNGA